MCEIEISLRKKALIVRTFVRLLVGYFNIK